VRDAYQRYHLANGVISPSEFGRQQLLQLGLASEKTHVVRHAVQFPEAPVDQGKSPVRCLVVGRMDAMKGHVLAMDAFRLAREQYPDLTLEFAGDGILLPALRQLAMAHRMADRVKFHGFLSHQRTLDCIRASHILLHPSVADADRYDTSPVSVAEAMAHGLAIIGSRHGGITEQIIDGESGFVVPEYDTQTMAARLVTLARDVELRRQFGRAARQRAQALFDPATVQRHWLNLLQMNEPAVAPSLTSA